MSDPFLGEIKAVGFNFAPQGWAKCYGQLIQIQQNAALYALLATYYGGDGVTTFGLPDLRGKSIVGEGMGPGLSNKIMGEFGGYEYITLDVAHMPAHTHGASIAGTATGTFQLDASDGNADCQSPEGKIFAKSQTADARDPQTVNSYTDASKGGHLMAPNNVNIDLSDASVVVDPKGGSQAFPVRNPYQVANYIIATTGLFPPRQ